MTIERAMLNKTIEMEHNRRHSCSTKSEEHAYIYEKLGHGQVPGNATNTAAFNNMSRHYPEMSKHLLVFS